jgi:hypothetical protein
MVQTLQYKHTYTVYSCYQLQIIKILWCSRMYFTNFAENTLMLNSKNFLLNFFVYLSFLVINFSFLKNILLLIILSLVYSINWKLNKIIIRIKVISIHNKILIPVDIQTHVEFQGIANFRCRILQQASFFKWITLLSFILNSEQNLIFWSGVSQASQVSY